MRKSRSLFIEFYKIPFLNYNYCLCKKGDYGKRIDDTQP